MINKPTLFLDKEKTLNNIDRMASKFLEQRIHFQPHAKTHQSRAIANWFRDFGVNSLTVSSIEMLSYFANDQWDKLLLALPIHPVIFRQLNDWNNKIDLTVISSSLKHIRTFNNILDKPIKLLIDCDPKYGRTGIPIHDHESISILINEVKALKNIQLSGCYLHAGHSYNCSSIEEIQRFYSSQSEHIKALKNTFQTPIYFGDTPTCSVVNNFSNIDVATPGNFVFYDIMQATIGSCNVEDISIELACPVIDWKSNGNQAQLIIHGGAVHFSKDSMIINEQTIYGQLSGYPNIYVHKLSQEHGLLYGPSPLIEVLAEQTQVNIYPVHSCLTAQSMGFYIDRENGLEYDHMSKNH